jgi:hypothetical protein
METDGGGWTVSVKLTPDVIITANRFLHRLYKDKIMVILGIMIINCLYITRQF